MQFLAKTSMIFAVGLSLAGCAAINGSQTPVAALTPRTLVAIDDALWAYHQPYDYWRLDMSRRAYRDYILSSYLSAINANYTNFTNQLQSSDRGSALGLDLLVLGLTGATALAGASDVNELATITAVASGTRSTIDKRLFFDHTLPAIIASLDAERATIQADITRKRALPIEQYSLDEAIDDLNRLQQAGRLDRAVARMTKVAEADRALQQQRLDSIAAACDDISTQAAELNREFRLLVLTGTDSQPERLSAAAEELGMEVADGTSPTWPEVSAAFDEKLCDDAKKRSFIDSLKARLNSGAGGGNG